MSELTLEEKFERFIKDFEYKTSRMVLIRERFWEELAKKASTFGSLCGSVWFGVYLGSVTLQIIAGTIWLLYVIGNFIGDYKKNTYTLDEAAAIIAEWKQGE